MPLNPPNSSHSPSLALSWQGIHAVPLVPLRIATGVLMIHHGSEGGFGPANFGTPQFDGFNDFVLKVYIYGYEVSSTLSQALNAT